MSATFTILHVDDDSNDLTLFQHACRRAHVSFDVQPVQEGQRALDYLSGLGPYADRSKHPMPSLILLDLKLPGINGNQVLDWVRHHEKLKSLPVVIFSSSTQEDDIKHAYELGANSFLVKPIDLDGLIEVARLIDTYWVNLCRQACIS